MGNKKVGNTPRGGKMPKGKATGGAKGVAKGGGKKGGGKGK